MTTLPTVAGVKALVFDVFGTVVDWRGSIETQGAAFALEAGVDVDWARLADAWRGKYGPSMGRVRRGEVAWQNLDALHRASLEEVLAEFGVEGLGEEQKQQLTRFWHRLTPWSDSVPGLTQLRAHYLIAPLSNGNVALLTNMAKLAGLPWDCILSAELMRAYKPDPAVYLGAAALLDLRPDQVMMVAAHAGDLRAASAAGLRTAYVPRPLEWGSERPFVPDSGEWFDVVAESFLALADRLVDVGRQQPS